MQNTYLGKIINIDLFAKNVFTDKGIKAIMPSSAKFGDHIGLDSERRTYVMSEEESSLYTQPDGERQYVEEMATKLGISFQKNTKNETLKKKIEEAMNASSIETPEMNTGEPNV